MRLVFSIAVALIAGACTSLTAESLPDQPVNGDFDVHGINWASGEKVTFAFRVFEDAGKIAICGSYSESSGGDVNQTAFNDRLVQTAYLKMGDDTLVNDISFFSKGRYVEGQRPDGEANCIRLDDPWAPGMSKKEASLAFAKTSFVVYN